MSNHPSDISKKFRDLRLRSGLTMEALAKGLGYRGRSSIQRYEDPGLFKKTEIPQHIVRKLLTILEGKGEPPITREEILELAGGATFYGKKSQEISLTLLPVLGTVAAGVWLESDSAEEKFAPVPILPDPQYPISSQFGVVVRGTSMNQVALDGDILICVSLHENAIEAKENDLVVVRRVRDQGGLIETTAKKLKKNGHYELWPVSDDPKYQKPIVVPDDNSEQDEAIEVAAVVVGVYRPLRR